MTEITPSNCLVDDVLKLVLGQQKPTNQALLSGDIGQEANRKGRAFCLTLLLCEPDFFSREPGNRQEGAQAREGKKRGEGTVGGPGWANGGGMGLCKHNSQTKQKPCMRLEGSVIREAIRIT